MTDDIVLGTAELETPWQTIDPFLFCMHHEDDYPAGNEQMGPDPSMLQGRRLGNDFSGRDGWSMYHGETVPGFPQHPHRGFETITLARSGYIDHSDSLGAKARFGEGDVQWMTAGEGIVHSEMFPMVHRDRRNPTELFQIWLNLPRESKQKEPYFTMFWSEDVPRRTFRDDEGRETEVTVVAGAIEDAEPPEPPPTSWASRDETEVAVWTIRMEPDARWELPEASSEVNRVFYFFEGGDCEVAGRDVGSNRGIQLRGDAACPVVNGETPSEFVLLQGRPIDEPVVKHGPFVMNHEGEIKQTMLDYQRTQFGGWPWDEGEVVHPRDAGRFALHPDGREERP